MLGVCDRSLRKKQPGNRTETIRRFTKQKNEKKKSKTLRKKRAEDEENEGRGEREGEEGRRGLFPWLLLTDMDYPSWLLGSNRLHHGFLKLLLLLLTWHYPFDCQHLFILIFCFILRTLKNTKVKEGGAYFRDPRLMDMSPFNRYLDVKDNFRIAIVDVIESHWFRPSLIWAYSMPIAFVSLSSNFFVPLN